MTKEEIQKNIHPFVMKSEGGFTNDKADEVTYKGITLSNFPTWKGWKFLLKIGFSNIAEGKIFPELENDVFEFYYQNFYLPFVTLKNWKVALYLIDFKINGGLNLTDLLKYFKIASIEGLNKIKESDIFNFLEKKRVEHWQKVIKKNPAKKKFYDGWIIRLKKLNTLVGFTSQNSGLTLLLCFVFIGVVIYKIY